MEIDQYDEEFIGVFNEYYPFERYIMHKPVSLDFAFDDVQLVEVFMPSMETDKPVDTDEIYLKVICKGVEARFAYFDFSENIRETVRDAVISDFGDDMWECLYVEVDDNKQMFVDALNEEKKLIERKYGECHVKENFQIESTKSVLNNGCYE